MEFAWVSKEWRACSVLDEYLSAFPPPEDRFYPLSTIPHRAQGLGLHFAFLFVSYTGYSICTIDRITFTTAQTRFGIFSHR